MEFFLRIEFFLEGIGVVFYFWIMILLSLIPMHESLLAASDQISIADELLSPVDTKAWGPFFTGMALTLGAVMMEDPVVDPVQEEAIREKPLGRMSTFGDIMGQLVPNALYYVGMKTHGYWSANDQSHLRAQIMLKATLYSSLVTNMLKYTIREPRPNGSARNSFPSGHTTSAFAFASMVGATHGWKWGIPAYGIAGFVGASRINDNAHWLHDVIGGATIGIGYGLGLVYLLEQDQADHDGDVSFKMIYPTINRSGAGLTYVHLF